MSQSIDADFYRRRERQERTLAEGASTPEGQRIHRELADHYASLLNDMDRPTVRSRAMS